MIIIALTIVTMFIMRARIQSLKLDIKTEKDESARIQNNYDVSQDSIKTYLDDNKVMTSEISAYKLNVNELNVKYKTLFSLYLKEKNKPPIYLIEYRSKIDEKITNISTIVSDTSISFVDSARFSANNYRTISGYIPYKLTYHIKKDLVNKFAFEQALYYAYILEENGCDEAKVVAFKDNKEITIKEALKIKNEVVVYKVRILQSDQKLTFKEISDRYKIGENLISTNNINGKFEYYVGSVIPFKNIEPIVDDDAIDTYAKINTFPATINFKQGMEVYAGLYTDKKTGKTMINVKSLYPGLTFTNIVGADIMQDPISRKAARDFRREFGFGINLGYGMFFNNAPGGYVIETGPTIAIGLNWTPRFLQFGPSKK